MVVFQYDSDERYASKIRSMRPLGDERHEKNRRTSDRINEDELGPVEKNEKQDPAFRRAYTSHRGKNGPKRIPRETARRGREEIGHQFYRYVFFFLSMSKCTHKCY